MMIGSIHIDLGFSLWWIAAALGWCAIGVVINGLVLVKPADFRFWRVLGDPEDPYWTMVFLLSPLWPAVLAFVWYTSVIGRISDEPDDRDRRR